MRTLKAGSYLLTIILILSNYSVHAEDVLVQGILQDRGETPVSYGDVTVRDNSTLEEENGVTWQNGYFQLWIEVISSDVRDEVMGISRNSLHINCVDDIVDINATAPGYVSLYNILGQVVGRQIIQRGQNFVDIHNLANHAVAAGIYIIRVRTTDYESTAKLAVTGYDILSSNHIFSPDVSHTQNGQKLLNGTHTLIADCFGYTTEEKHITPGVDHTSVSDVFEMNRMASFSGVTPDTIHLQNNSTYNANSLVNDDVLDGDWSSNNVNVTVSDGIIGALIEGEFSVNISYYEKMVDGSLTGEQISFTTVVKRVDDSGNYAPVYVGGLDDMVVTVGNTLNIDLNAAFEDDHTHDDYLIYQCNKVELSIENGIASWTPAAAGTLTNVIFKAIDEGGLETLAPGINLTAEDNSQPTIRISGKVLDVGGQGANPDLQGWAVASNALQDTAWARASDGYFEMNVPETANIDSIMFGYKTIDGRAASFIATKRNVDGSHDQYIERAVLRIDDLEGTGTSPLECKAIIIYSNSTIEHNQTYQQAGEAYLQGLNPDHQEIISKKNPLTGYEYSETELDALITQITTRSGEILTHAYPLSVDRSAEGYFPTSESERRGKTLIIKGGPSFGATEYDNNGHRIDFCGIELAAPISRPQDTDEELLAGFGQFNAIGSDTGRDDGLTLRDKSIAYEPSDGTQEVQIGDIKTAELTNAIYGNFAQFISSEGIKVIDFLGFP